MAAVVFLSAAPSVRALCLPELVGGFETALDDADWEAGEVRVLALQAPLARTPEGDAVAPPEVWLVGRPTGRAWRGTVPWWEVRREGEWV